MRLFVVEDIPSFDGFAEQDWLGDLGTRTKKPPYAVVRLILASLPAIPPNEACFVPKWTLYRGGTKFYMRFTGLTNDRHLKQALLTRPYSRIQKDGLLELGTLRRFAHGNLHPYSRLFCWPSPVQLCQKLRRAHTSDLIHPTWADGAQIHVGGRNPSLRVCPLECRAYD